MQFLLSFSTLSFDLRIIDQASEHSKAGRVSTLELGKTGYRMEMARSFTIMVTNMKENFAKDSKMVTENSVSLLSVMFTLVTFKMECGMGRELKRMDLLEKLMLVNLSMIPDGVWVRLITKMAVLNILGLGFKDLRMAMVPCFYKMGKNILVNFNQDDL